ncbi:MAG: type I-D CRISPR-associated protein Cas7/Csc2 [Chloroflexi bacterium]|nr:type I-D CRISPR-associated protein Cas7/Csc2 [Chloroflexota bacterium]
MQTLNTGWFPKAVPGKPMGYYAHIIMLRVTDSYTLFQTDGELNTTRVRAGLQDATLMTRLTIFKRKQSTPERLVGRELLRRYGFLSGDIGGDKKDTGSDGLPICDYNVQFCTMCPDCISYGFAIGDRGSEKSKVITDTAFSLTSFDQSHEAFTLNAPYEDGTMTRFGDVTSRINEQDHVQPQVIFPSVVTVRDLTYSLFRYVVENIRRTRRYGAQTTRTGRMENQILAIVLADREIFSNLRFTQRMYDCLQESQKITPHDPVDPQGAFQAAQTIIPELLAEDGVDADALLTGEPLTAYLQTLADETRSEEGIRRLLASAFQDSSAYHAVWGAKTKKAARKGK